MQVTDLAGGQPRALDRCNAGGDVARLVAADEVEGQGRAGFVQITDFAVGNQTQLDQCLEAVADTKYKTISVV